MRTVQLLFRLPRDSNPRSIRERVEFLKLACLHLGLRTAYYRATFFALNGAFCGWPGRGERLLRAKLFRGGAGARNQVQSRAEYRCTLLSSSAISQ